MSEKKVPYEYILAAQTTNVITVIGSPHDPRYHMIQKLYIECMVCKERESLWSEMGQFHTNPLSYTLCDKCKSQPIPPQMIKAASDEDIKNE